MPLSIEGHSWLVPGELGAGQVPAEDGNMGAYICGARELMIGLRGSRESLVPIDLALSMELRQLVEQVSTGVHHSSITPCKWQKVLNQELMKALPLSEISSRGGPNTVNQLR